MNDTTKQTDVWSSDFGQQYTDRNPHSPQDMDVLYARQFGISRTALNQEFLGDMDRTLRILEVGANVGTQLQALQDLGFKNLYGIELQAYAVEQAKKYTKGINLIQGTAFDLPFRDGWFDVVYTSGVLIHISPDHIKQALAEILRCSRRYVWGFEYFEETYTSIPYRGRDDLLWKTDFAHLYQTVNTHLRLVKERKIPYVGSSNVDQMYLLEKQV
ncbi:MAG: pseudaminic acid biosynthesis-associated methylase [bacterium]